MSLPVYTVCVPCGALIHDQVVHTAFHARLDASAQAMQASLAQGMAALHALSPETTPAPAGETALAPISGRVAPDEPPAAPSADPTTTEGAPA